MSTLKGLERIVQAATMSIAAPTTALWAWMGTHLDGEISGEALLGTEANRAAKLREGERA